MLNRSDVIIYQTILDAAIQRSAHIYTRHPAADDFEVSMLQAVPFNISEVYDWLCLEKTGEPLITLFDHLGPCRPPFDHTYMEWDLRDMDLPHPRIGLILYTGSKTAATDPDLWGFHGVPLDPALPEEVEAPFIALPDDGCVVWGRLLLGDRVGAVGTYAGCHIFFGLDGHGQLLRHTDAHGGWLGYRISIEDDPDRPEDAESRAETRTMLAEAMYTALFACSLLHCTNVGTQDNHLPRQLARARARRQLPPIDWKTLTVSQPTRKPLDETRRYVSDNVGGTRHRQHIVRGYFAEYGVNGRGLLFGKHAGRYWIPPHIRGIEGPGVILKDYAITPARNQTPALRVAAKRKVRS